MAQPGSAKGDEAHSPIWATTATKEVLKDTMAQMRLNSRSPKNQDDAVRILCAFYMEHRRGEGPHIPGTERKKGGLK